MRPREPDRFLVRSMVNVYTRDIWSCAVISAWLFMSNWFRFDLQSALRISVPVFLGSAAISSAFIFLRAEREPALPRMPFSVSLFSSIAISLLVLVLGLAILVITGSSAGGAIRSAGFHAVITFACALAMGLTCTTDVELSE